MRTLTENQAHKHRFGSSHFEAAVMTDSGIVFGVLNKLSDDGSIEAHVSAYRKFLDGLENYNQEPHKLKLIDIVSQHYGSLHLTFSSQKLDLPQVSQWPFVEMFHERLQKLSGTLNFDVGYDNASKSVIPGFESKPGEISIGVFRKEPDVLVDRVNAELTAIKLDEIKALIQEVFKEAKKDSKTAAAADKVCRALGLSIIGHEHEINNIKPTFEPKFKALSIAVDRAAEFITFKALNNIALKNAKSEEQKFDLEMGLTYNPDQEGPHRICIGEKALDLLKDITRKQFEKEVYTVSRAAFVAHLAEERKGKGARLG